jgi:RNA polymerase sigma factor (sigma-70 family)
MGASGTENASGFERLVEPHLERLYRFAWRLTGSRPEAEDLFQDVLVKAFDSLPELAKIAEPGSWLCRVMYNHFVDNTRQFARRRLVSVAESQLPDASIESLSGDLDPVREVERQQHIVKLDRALSALGDDYRFVLLMHDVEGYKITEIQAITGHPVGTIKSRLHRARARLRDLLEADATFFRSEACKRVTEEETDAVPATE